MALDTTIPRNADNSNALFALHGKDLFFIEAATWPLIRHELSAY
jgi:hypothetical protein